MAEDQDKSSKTEEATPHRLEKAREDGQVARSKELTTFTMLMGGAVALTMMGGHMFAETRTMMEQAFTFDRHGIQEPDLMLVGLGQMATQGLYALLPVFLFTTVLALVSPMLLGGFLISAKSLKPQASRLNPISGFKRIFSSQALSELAKVLVKILLLGSIASLYLYSHYDEFIHLIKQPVDLAIGNVMSLATEACRIIVLALLAVILIDVPYQLWHHAKQLRMSKDEIKREHKEIEGDPLTKSRIRAQQQAMARQRMMSKVPDADVIITNPTHYAVALSYDDKSLAAPRVVAKGADAVAQRIREIGGEHRVPIIEAPRVARTLFRYVDLDREIPTELFRVVAEILAWAVGLKKGKVFDRAKLKALKNLDVPESMRVD